MDLEHALKALKTAHGIAREAGPDTLVQVAQDAAFAFIHFHGDYHRWQKRRERVSGHRARKTAILRKRAEAKAAEQAAKAARMAAHSTEADLGPDFPTHDGTATGVPK